jgi:hypothetical protein
MRNSIALLILGAGVLTAAVVAFSYTRQESAHSNADKRMQNIQPGLSAPASEGGNLEGCKASVRATGAPALTTLAAQLNAHRAWKHEAQAVYTGIFTWASARERTVECERRGLVKRCTATAHPCRG